MEVPQNTYNVKQAVLNMDPEREAYAHMKKTLNYERKDKVLLFTGPEVRITYLG